MENFLKVLKQVKESANNLIASRNFNFNCIVNHECFYALYSKTNIFSKQQMSTHTLP